jgi:hypothetical protein
MLSHPSQVATPSEIVLNGSKIDSVASKLKLLDWIYKLTSNAIKAILSIRPWHILIMQSKNFLAARWPVDAGLIELRECPAKNGLLCGARIFQILRRKK